MNRDMIKVAGAASALILLGGCELGAKDSTQTGYRGTGMDQITDRSSEIKASAIPAAAYAYPPAGGPSAAASYQNVKVLGALSKDQFDQSMAEMTQWVAPAAEGCNYCHNPANLASDEKYTKVVARRMIEMTRAINARWSSHVKGTGVTCYTCHRGNAVPENIWSVAEGTPDSGTIRGNKRGQNSPNANVGYAALPYEPFSQYLTGQQQFKVASGSALPTAGHKLSIVDTEKAYGMMMHISSALGVNCTYCHNTQSFRAWNLSRAQRGTAYYGLRMVRDINSAYLGSLQSIFPADRKGPHGDVYKVNCTTCHQGQPKPLGGTSMLSRAPWLTGAPLPAAVPEGGPAAATAVPEAFNRPAAMTDSN